MRNINESIITSCKISIDNRCVDTYLEFGLWTFLMDKLYRPNLRTIYTANQQLTLTDND